MLRRETELKAICNICVLVAIIGILLITISGGDKAFVFWGYAISNIGSIGGIIFGMALEKAEKRRKCGVVNIIYRYAKPAKMYTFAEYIHDNDTSVRELRNLIKMDRQRKDERAHDIYEHYKASARGSIVSPPEDIYKILLCEGKRRDMDV